MFSVNVWHTAKWSYIEKKYNRSYIKKNKIVAIDCPPQSWSDWFDGFEWLDRWKVDKNREIYWSCYLGNPLCEKVKIVQVTLSSSSLDILCHSSGKSNSDTQLDVCQKHKKICKAIIVYYTSIFVEIKLFIINIFINSSRRKRKIVIVEVVKRRVT